MNYELSRGRYQLLAQCLQPVATNQQLLTLLVCKKSLIISDEWLIPDFLGQSWTLFRNGLERIKKQKPRMFQDNTNEVSKHKAKARKHGYLAFLQLEHNAKLDKLKKHLWHGNL